MILDPSDILTHDVDDFIIGDRVWVNGSKPGYIQFIGETQFAPGDWAGVVLDEPIGKNDGAVSGVRYFQCEPRRGVFARPQRLSRYPTTVAALNSGPNDSTLIQESPGKSVTTRVSNTRVVADSPWTEVSFLPWTLLCRNLISITSTKLSKYENCLSIPFLYCII